MLALRRQLEQKSKEPSGMRFSPKEFVVVLTGVLLAIAGVFADDARIVYPCLVISWIAFIYVCFIHSGSRRWRFTVGILITAIFGKLVFSVYERALEREQNDVYAKLSIQPIMPASRNVLKTGIAVTNDGGTDIKDHSVQCYLRRIVYAPYGGIANIGVETTLPERPRLRAHGDGETSYCIAGIQSFPPDTHPFCADITVTVSYTLETQPKVPKTKQWRFVADGDDFVYRRQPIEYPGDYCPESRIPPQPPFT
jgi:hypothetical protein